MEKAAFNKMTREIFKEYGFVKEKERYILFLEDITIVVRLASWRGVKSFDYYFSINEMFDPTVPVTQRYSTVTELHAEHDLNAQGYHRHEILYEEYTEEEYRALLTNLLHRIFDPFKEGGLMYLKDNNLFMNRKTKEYLITKFASEQ